MNLQKNVFKLTLIFSIVFFLIFSSCYFISNGYSHSSLLEWTIQVSISLCTGFFTAALIALWSYKKLQRDSYKILAQEFRRIFDIVDDYLCVVENGTISFDDYYTFRNCFLQTTLIVERESMHVSAKEKPFVLNALNELYIIPRGMLYYSYKQIKNLEKIHQKSSLSLDEISNILNQELLELNIHLYKLKAENAYNISAEKLYTLAGEDSSTFLSIDTFECTYKTNFYEDK